MFKGENAAAEAGGDEAVGREPGDGALAGAEVEGGEATEGAVEVDADAVAL